MSLESKCPRCGREMYFCSNGMYECRSDDCPPGTRKRYEANLNLGNRLLGEMRCWSPSRFRTVEDLAYVVHLCNDSFPLANGKLLKEIKERTK
jgi:hypothetical protein